MATTHEQEVLKAVHNLRKAYAMLHTKQQEEDGAHAAYQDACAATRDARKETDELSKKLLRAVATPT